MKLFRPVIVLALALAGLAVAHAQVPTWPKSTPSDVTAAGINVQLRGADYGNGTFVLSAYFGGSNAVPAVTPAVYTSPDGTTWTKRTLPVTGARIGVPRFVNGKFFIGMDAATVNGLPTGANGAVLSSADGITWTASTLSAPLYGPYEFSFGNGVYVGPVGRTGSTGSQIVTSTDGATWTPRTIVAGTSTNHVTFFSGKFYATVYGSSTTSLNGLYASTDGVTWARVAGAPLNPGLLAAGPSTLLTTYFSTVSGQSLSSDGVTFTTASPGIVLQSETIRYLNGAFVTTASPTSTSFDLNLARASFDGKTWATIGSTTNVSYSNEVAYGGGRYVFVGEYDVFAGTTTVSPGGTSTGGGTPTPAPTVTAQPAAAQSIPLGGSVTFTFTVTGTGITYQWFFNGVAISGAVNFNYTIGSVTAANAGSYTVTATNSGGTVTSAASVLSVTAAAPGVAYLSNASVLARAGTGSEILTVGVTISAGTGSKNVLIRGIGPTLAAFNVVGALADPTLAVFRGQTQIDANDDWGNDSAIAAAMSAVGAFSLTPTSKDAALYATGAASGGYTVQLAGKAGATGTGLIELYDDAAAASVTAASSRLTNISARTFGGTGSSTLILGFTVSGTGTRRVLIRASGPALIPLGVTGTMPDPKLELYNSAGAKLDENDNWDAATVATQASVGAFTFTAGSKDAVLIATLAPGGYTAQVVAVGGATGVALVEIYELP